jgi:hypothetical protein
MYDPLSLEKKESSRVAVVTIASPVVQAKIERAADM